MVIAEANTLTEAARGVRQGRAVRSSGVGGDLLAAPDGDRWVCRFLRFGAPVEYRILSEKMAVYAWLRVWFPRLRRERPQHKRRPGSRPAVAR